MKSTDARGRTNGHHPKIVQGEAPLFDLELERTIIGSCVIDPALIPSVQVSLDDFYSESHRLIWRELVYLAAEGEPVGSWALRSRLLDLGKLQSVGGDEYLSDLTDKVIRVSPLPTKRLQRLAIERRLRYAALRLAGRLGAHGVAAELLAIETARVELDVLSSPAGELPSASECVRAMRPETVRFSTGLAALDEVTRGGIPLGRLIVLAGAPGASKTNISAGLADRWERAGCAVAYIAADESRESILVRLGQLDGWNRDALEHEDTAVREGFARHLTGRSIAVVDPVEDKLTLEDVDKRLTLMAAGKPRVLIVDSLQNTPCAAASGFATKKEAIDAMIEVCKSICKKGVIVVAISEMSRAAYRTGARDKDISALAAAKESGSIEYAAHLILGLRSVAGEAGQIDIEVAKNRLGPGKPEIRTALDFQTLGLREIERPNQDETETERARFARDRLLQTIARHHDLRSAAAVSRTAGGRKSDNLAMLRELLEEGAVCKVGGVFRTNIGVDHG